MRLISHQRLLPAMVLLIGFIVVVPAPKSQQNSTGEAAQSSSKRATGDSDSQMTPENVGDALFFHHRYEKAIAAYKKAPKDSSPVWNKMGIAYEMLLDLKDAERCYKESLRLNPGDARVWNNLGTVYDALREHGKAELQYRKALHLNPNSPVALRNLGTNLIFQNDYDGGQELYRRALALDSNVFEGLDVPAASSVASVRQLGAMNYYKAEGYAQAGRAGLALQYLRRAFSEGFASREQIAQDNSFDKLRGNPGFEQLMAEEQGD